MAETRNYSKFVKGVVGDERGNRQADMAHTRTPQSQPIPGHEEDMILNRAGGYTFKVDALQQVRRWLVLGSPDTYYASAQQLTAENAQVFIDALDEHGEPVIQLLEDAVSTSKDEYGNTIPAPAKKNVPLFALALAKVVTSADREDIHRAIHDVIRRGRLISTASQMYQFMHHMWDLTREATGVGRIPQGSGMRRAVQDWLRRKDARWLAMQAAKYGKRSFAYGTSPGRFGRGGSKRSHSVSMKDVLRLCHPKPQDETEDRLFSYITHRDDYSREQAIELLREFDDDALGQLLAFEEAFVLPHSELPEHIYRNGLTWEMLPTEVFSGNHVVSVWKALMGVDAPSGMGDVWNMPLMALIRNLPRITASGAIGDRAVRQHIMDRLTGDEALEELVRARIHPIQLLTALFTYRSGKSRGSLTWEPNAPVEDALETAFYNSFGVVPSTGLRWMYGLDVSGSMTWGNINGLPMLLPVHVTAVLAKVLMHSERDYVLKGFSGRLQDIRGFNKQSSIEQAVHAMNQMNFGSTDVSLPFQWAINNGEFIDVFVVITDNETWSGSEQPAEALARYRRLINPEARAVAIALTANSSSNLYPGDTKALEVVGFDASAPQTIADFALGRV